MLPMNGLSTLPSARSGLCDVTITADLESFVEVHHSHGRLEGEIGDLTANGYRLAVACSCGVTFHRWITPREAAEDLACSVLRAVSYSAILTRSRPSAFAR